MTFWFYCIVWCFLQPLLSEIKNVLWIISPKVWSCGLSGLWTPVIVYLGRYVKRDFFRFSVSFPKHEENNEKKPGSYCSLPGFVQFSRSFKSNDPKNSKFHFSLYTFNPNSYLNRVLTHVRDRRESHGHNIRVRPKLGKQIISGLHT